MKSARRFKLGTFANVRLLMIQQKVEVSYENMIVRQRRFWLSASITLDSNDNTVLIHFYSDLMLYNLYTSSVRTRTA